MFGIWLKIKSSHDSWGKNLCGFSPGSSQARRAPWAGFARDALAAAPRRRLTFLAALAVVETQNVSSYPHPHTRSFDPRNVFLSTGGLQGSWGGRTP